MGGNGGFGYDVRSPPGPGPHCAEDVGGITQASRPSLQIPREASSPQAPLRAHVPGCLLSGGPCPRAVGPSLEAFLGQRRAGSGLGLPLRARIRR